MDFALIMFVLLLVTGGIWLLERFVLAAKRGSGVAEPWWVEYAKVSFRSFWWYFSSAPF